MTDPLQRHTPDEILNAVLNLTGQSTGFESRDIGNLINRMREPLSPLDLAKRRINILRLALDTASIELETGTTSTEVREYIAKVLIADVDTLAHEEPSDAPS